MPALTKTALALLGPLQKDDELQEIFSVAEDKELRLRTLAEELHGGSDDEAGTADAEDADDSDAVE